MLTLAIPLSIVGLGVFCWLLYSLAIYALPFFIGLSVALYAHESGAGALGAMMLGVTAGAVVLALAQRAMALARSSWLRLLLGLAFSVPAAIAGYYATFALAGLTFPTDVWRQVFAFVGAAAIGTTAWQRLAPMPADQARHHMPAS